ncbi:hypothetical protein WJX75_005941 [Coccomyxa subellipsoidea]|uniref:Kinesin motor domain-containing protein n=1 Tax=Coccomyxa subellipsoidea TaxID=248742 RepID=A0ABR2YL80_9CHLO
MLLQYLFTGIHGYLVPSAAANFVELEALRWENRKLTDAKLVAETQATDQARRIAQLEETLAELRLRPAAGRGAADGEGDPVTTLERQLSKLTEELQTARAEAQGRREEVAEAARERAGAAKRVSDAVAERDLARQMLKGVQAMLGHAEAARCSAQKALQQAQAEKSASQAVLAESEAKRNRHAAELEAIRISREQAEAQLAAAQAKLKATQAVLGQAEQGLDGLLQEAALSDGDTVSPPTAAIESRLATLQGELHSAKVETERLQAVLAEKESILQDAQDKLTALESECSALRAAVGKAEAACADLQSRLAAAEADRAASAAGLEAQVAQLTLDLASKEEYLKNLQAQSSTAAATEAAKASGAPSSVTQGIKELESELATAQETLRAAEEAARQRAEELGRWASAADRAAADQAAKIAELEAERESARRSALAELTACRDAGLQAVYELEAQVSELAAEKERLQAEVVRQRASLSKNRAQAEEELAVAEAKLEKLQAEKRDAVASLAEAEARANAAEAELAEARAAHGRTAAEATQHLEARIGELTAARDSAAAEAERLREQVAELSAERNYAVANKQQAAEAAATLEAEAAGLLEQKKQAVTALQSQISQLKMERETMKKTQEGVQAALEQLQGKVEAERAGNKDAFARLQAAAEAEEAARRAAEGKLAEAEAAAEQLRSRSAADLRRLQDEKRAADARISALQTRLDGMQCAAGGVDTQKVKVEEFAAALREARAEAAELRQQLAEAAGGHSPGPAERQPLQLSPRVLPSSVKAAAQQKARARCRVFARVRPMTRAEQAARQGTPLKVADRESLLLAGGQGGSQRYGFDRVFSPEEGQEAVYKEVSSLVSAVMEGANGCVLAFGQSGSGKAHTLAGTPEHPGINFRAMSHLFKMAKDGSSARDTRIAMSIVEIHGESIQDLLSNDPYRRLDVKSVEDGVCVPGLSIKQIASTANVEAVMCSASAQQHSSASHLVLSVYVACKDRTTGATALGKLHMVNLAASEMAEREGDGSLRTLGSCLQALRQNAASVPYGESCLTRLLADSMGQDRSRAVLIATCSPLASDAAETRRTLDFCARLAAGIVACPPRAAGEGMPGSPATGTVADLASVFGGATPRTSSPGGRLFSPGRGVGQARNAARKLDMNAVTSPVQPSPRSPQRFSGRHAN